MDRLLCKSACLRISLLLMLMNVGCYKENTKKTAVDLSTLSDRIAILGPSAAILDFGKIDKDATADLTLTITNAGPTPASKLSVSSTDMVAPFGFKGGTTPGTQGTCTTSIAGKEACTYVLTYSPTSHGEHSGIFTLSYFNGAVTTELQVSLVGETTASLSLSDGATYDFGTKALNSSTHKTFTLTNAGYNPAVSLQADIAAPLAAPFSFKGGAYPGTGGTCGATLSGSSTTCTVIVTYNPTTGGDYSQTLSLSFNNGTTSATVTRAMTGKTPALLTISDGATYDFGNYGKGATATKTFTITNSGGVAATLMAEAASDPLAAPYDFLGGTYPGTGGTCGASLAVNATCTVVVSFAPTATSTATYNETLSIDYYDGTTGGVANLIATRSMTAVGQSGWNAASASGLTARNFASTVWASNVSKAMIWGGEQGSATKYSDGKMYDPVTDAWTAISTTDAPIARGRHTVVWASTLNPPRAIIFGGLAAGDSALLEGAIYTPSTDTWVTMSNSGAPNPRYGHTAVWDTVNNKMIVWGGASTNVLTSGLGYEFDPTNGAGGTWNDINDGLLNTPAARYNHSAIWTGTKMIIWGGCGSKNAATGSCTVAGELSSGASYNPANGTWTALSAGPTARFGHTATYLSSSSEMVIWGGGSDTTGNATAITPVSTGSVYNIAGDSWSAVTNVTAPFTRYDHLAFDRGATGLHILGGLVGNASNSFWTSNAWTTGSTTSAPTDTFGASGAYTGSSDLRVLVFGGADDDVTPGAYSSSLYLHAAE